MYRGGAEKKIRQYLIDNNYIDCIIQLPDNLFYGTSIAPCIMVLKKSKSENNTLFIDASKEFVKVTNKNKLTQDNIEHILDAFKARKDIPYSLNLWQTARLQSRITIFPFPPWNRRTLSRWNYLGNLPNHRIATNRINNILSYLFSK